jgi:hypothetical protein
VTWQGCLPSFRCTFNWLLPSSPLYSCGIVIPSASTRVLAPRSGDWGDEHGSTKGHFGKAFGAIPKELRDQLTELIASNPRAGIKVGSNVGASRDLQIK